VSAGDVSRKSAFICFAASPCAQLSGALSTTSESDFHCSVCLSQECSIRPAYSARFRYEPRPPWISQVPQCFRFRTCRALRPRRSLRSPSPLAVTYYCLPATTTLSACGLLSSRGSIASLALRPASRSCLRLTHVVASMSPRLDSRWGGSFPFPRREFRPLEASGFS
jgi:hypothetical protein